MCQPHSVDGWLYGEMEAGRGCLPEVGICKDVYSSGAYKVANKSYGELYPALKEKGDFCLSMGIACINQAFMMSQ